MQFIRIPICKIYFEQVYWELIPLVLLQLSFIDLSPDHAGTLYSVANSLSCVFLIASPYFTGMMIEEEVSHKVTHLLHYPYYRVTGG